MTPTLSPAAVRILGALVEKDLTTPEYYPLTLNALVTACNQKTNRDPVMTLTAEEVVEGLEELRREQLIYTSAEGVRTTRYCHHLDGLLHLEREELAVLALLLLRGAQTVGELRTRCERMVSFPDLQAVESALDNLTRHQPQLVIRLPRQPGHKENRYIDLLRAQESCTEAPAEADSSANFPAIATTADRIARLEQEVTLLREEVAALAESLEEFRTQFE